MKISIIGSGNVGGMTAMHLCFLGFSEIILVDAVPNLAEAKALDLSDARFMLGQNYRIYGTEDINKISASEILIITAGLTRKPGMTREQLLQQNSQIIKDICRDIRQLCPQAIIIVVTNPVDAMTYLVLKQTGFPANRVFGMGLTLDRARLANLIAEELNLDVEEIEPCIIGNHSEGMLPISRYTKIKGQTLDNYIKPEGINKLFQKTVQRGAEIVSKFGSGSAYFAPSTAIFELVKAIVQDEKKTLPVSVYTDGEYGLKDTCIGLPCCLGKKGIQKIIQIQLNEQEQTALHESAESIKKQISVILN